MELFGTFARLLDGSPEYQGFSPGLDKELLALIQASAEVEIASTNGATK